MTAEYKFTNNAETTLSASMGGGDTSFTVATGGGALFPAMTAPDNQRFMILVQDGSVEEYMIVTVRSGDNFSGITRGGANSFSGGSSVKLILTSQVLSTFLQKGVFRESVTDPDGVLSALYTGEEIKQTTTEEWWKHTTGTEWKKMTPT